MRLLIASLLVACSVSAHAKDAINIEKISDCLVLPGDAVENHIKATFEVTLDKVGKVKSVAVVSYEPQSEAAAAAARQLSRSVQRCWPPDVKTSPMRITVDLSKF
ncbi:hypothetical protein MesoLj113a_34900 [Mesorhizobium sp. 113-1-2]|uniref:hypothetical protein n=1 Tax=Mesorhizobium sp. 113-1-2 TaxID=2744515 RepID=UPI00081987F0|nr:hypothetical protein [Mesorhizobium sp. 113-1-2]BAV46420.1 Uncharacterized protein MLTONO_1517 [Mesorhizobium loti]BCG72332.1 hypothetical protein MesoLj113a_34900 [Mesorhizobium sp. 113-1-2]